MERSTQRKGRETFLTAEACNLCGYAEKRSSTFCENIGCISTKDRTCPYLQIIDRLAEYEDTGLSPEEVKILVQDIETRFILYVEKTYGMGVMGYLEAYKESRAQNDPHRPDKED